MTTNPTDDQIIAEGRRIVERRIDSAANEARALLDHIERSRAEQPQRLAEARAEADEARGWSLIEEPWADQVTAIPAYNAEGDQTCNTITLPNITAKELWGARLAFDMLDCGDDQDRLNEVQGRYFKMVEGDTGLAFLLAMSALSTIADTVVPQLLDEIETRAGNYDIRVTLAEARRKSWDGRVSELREADNGDALNDDATDGGDR